MALEAAAPAIMAVVFADFADRHETEVAVGANIVVPVIALETVKTGGGVWDRMGADVAVRSDREDLVCVGSAGWGVVGGSWRRRGRRAARHAADGKKGVRAAPALIDAAVAEPPVALIALVTLPVAVICWGQAAVAEETGG